MTKKMESVQERRASLAGAAINEESRSVRAALSSSEPVRRFFGTEVLVHKRSAIDLSRAKDNGLPLLINHDDRALPVGRVQNIGLESDGVLRGDLVFSEATQEARDAFALAQEGTLSDVSIRYQINKYDVKDRDSDNETYMITNWTPLEGSVVSVPADSTVGIGRQLNLLEDDTMSDDDKGAPAKVSPPADYSASRDAGREEGAALERTRQNDIDALARNFPGNAAVEDLATAAKSGGHTVEQFKTELLRALAGEPAEPLGQAVDRTRAISAGRDASDKLAEAVQTAIDYRTGNLSDEQRKALGQNEYLHMSQADLARMCLSSQGVSTRGLNAMDLIGEALVRYLEPGTANLTTASYTSLLLNSLNKSLFRGFEEAPITWNQWCGTTSVPDFKQAARPGVSQFTSLATVAENAAIQDGITTDKHEVFTVETFSRKYSITRQALVNDDLAGLADTGAKMGRAAARTVDEQVYSYLASNPVMNEDATNLFAAGHNNQAAADNTAPSTAAISEARVAMGRQTDWNGIVLGIVPQYMIVPLEHEENMLVLRTTSVDPDAANVTRNNVYQQLWQPISTPRLPAGTPPNHVWYMAGARGETITVAFLNGQQTPMLARDEGWSVLAAHMRVVLDFTVYAEDWRALFQFQTGP